MIKKNVDTGLGDIPTTAKEKSTKVPVANSDPQPEEGIPTMDYNSTPVVASSE